MAARQTQKSSHFKLVILGASDAGKTSLVIRYTQDRYTDGQQTTIGGSFFTNTIQVGNETVKMEIWDTAGQEVYQSLAPMYYRGAQAAIIVYDITSKESFTRAKFWVKELQKNADTDILVALAGNKADRGSAGSIERQVTNEDVKAFADANSFVFMETSAKTGMNVAELFTEIARRAPRAGSKDNLKLPTSPPPPAKGGCC